MEHKFTVIWRPLDTNEFRVDWVVVPDREYGTVMLAAAQQFIDETLWDDDETPPTPNDIIYGDAGGYDGVGVFEGHVRQVM